MSMAKMRVNHPVLRYDPEVILSMQKKNPSHCWDSHHAQRVMFSEMKVTRRVEARRPQWTSRTVDVDFSPGESKRHLKFLLQYWDIFWLLCWFVIEFANILFGCFCKFVPCRSNTATFDASPWVRMMETATSRTPSRLHGSEINSSWEMNSDSYSHTQSK